MKAKNSFKIAVGSIAVATGLALAPAASAQIMVPTSSEGTSSMMPVYLPDEAVAAAKQAGIKVPDFLVNPHVLRDLGIELEGKTNVHLSKSGHYHDSSAQGIAREWAQQAVRGQAKFAGNVGRGTTHLDKGDGNIYRLTEKQARDRLVWLNRTPNRTPEGKKFGVASAASANYVYLVEYFYN